MPVHEIFNSFEDLDLPKVAAINGMALGGGFEMCLVCDYRVMSEAAQVGLPEIKLGIYPGFGGSVRLSRLIGIDNAVEWIAMATQRNRLLHQRWRCRCCGLLVTNYLTLLLTYQTSDFWSFKLENAKKT